MGVIVVPKEELSKYIGHKFEPGPWVELSQQRINEFADCTDDHQFIHVDEEAAAKTPFGGMGVNYGFDKVRFLAPVHAGKRVRAHVEIADVQQKDDNRFLIKQNISVEIEGEETPALACEWLSMVFTG